MNRLNIIFYILLLNSCGLFLNESIEQKISGSTISGNDDVIVDSLLIPEDSLLHTPNNFEYPKFSKDIFHLIP